jgi:ribosomal protein L9
LTDDLGQVAPVVVVPATWRDLRAVWELEKLCFPDDAWPWIDVLAALTFPETVRLKALVAAAPGGYRRRPAGGEGLGGIATLGVHPGHRRRGIGARLLDRCEIDLGVPRIRLTLRPSNLGARRLYDQAGYQQIDVWRQYYRNGEDGVVMEKLLLTDRPSRGGASGKIDPVGRCTLRPQAPHQAPHLARKGLDPHACSPPQRRLQTGPRRRCQEGRRWLRAQLPAPHWPCWLPRALKQVEHIRHSATETRVRLNQELGAIAERLNGLQLVFPVKAGETGKLYGSITAGMLAEAIQKVSGAEVDKRQIDCQPIKALGIHKANVRLTIDLIPSVTILVHREAVSRVGVRRNRCSPGASRGQPSPSCPRILRPPRRPRTRPSGRRARVSAAATRKRTRLRKPSPLRAAPRRATPTP